LVTSQLCKQTAGAEAREAQPTTTNPRMRPILSFQH
jgi:hypothetical protein